MQAADVVHYVPPLIRVHGIGKGGHRSPIQAGNQVAEHFPIRLSTLKAGSAGKVERSDRITLVIRECSGRRAMSPAILTVTGPAIQTLEKFGAALHTLGRRRWFRRYHYRRTRFLFLEGWRERLYVCHQVGAFLPEQRLPGRHPAGVNATTDGVIEVAVERQAPARRRPAFEYGFRKVAGFRVKIRCTFASSIPLWTVAEDTVALVEGLSTVSPAD